MTVLSQSPGRHLERHCIIGAGPSGLCMAAELKRRSLPFDVLERSQDVGGIWQIESPDSPMYESAHFISSKTQSGFAGFPMPDTYPDYPSHEQILAYLRSFAASHQLEPYIQYGSHVTKVEPHDDHVEVVVGGETRRYRGVICASGTNWDPVVPHIPGVFSGEVRHARTYRSSSEFVGRRVLIVGLGNSGADIACDAARSAEQAYVSVRRGYHFIPKYIFGTPSDVFAHEGPHLPVWLEKKLFGWMLRLLVGDTTKLGMPKPDHALLDAHPLMNDQLLHYLRHGDVELRGDIERFEGPEVVFRDGSRLEVDLVLYATGYTKKIPYLDDRYLEGSWAAGNFLTCFSREFPRLFTLGFAEINGALYPHLSKMAELLGWVITAQLQQPEAATEFFAWTRRTRFDLTGGRKIIHTQRHEHYCDEYALSCALTAALRKVQKLAPSLPRAPAQLGS